MDGQNESGERGTLSKIMDFALPAAAFGASTYGPNYTAAVRTGLGALQRTDDIRRKHRLGKDVMRLADSMAEKDYAARSESYNKAKPKAAAQTEAEEIIEEAGGNDAMFATVPRPGQSRDAPEVAADKKMRGREEKRLDYFLESMPAPVKDDVYAQIGAMAMSDPDKALDMLMDRDNFSQTLRLKELDHYRSLVKDRVKMEYDEDARLDDREFRAAEGQANRAARAAETEATNALRMDITNAQVGMQETVAKIAAKSRIDASELYRKSQETIAKLGVEEKDRENSEKAITILIGYDAIPEEELTASQRKEKAWALRQMTAAIGEEDLEGLSEYYIEGVGVVQVADGKIVGAGGSAKGSGEGTGEPGKPDAASTEKTTRQGRGWSADQTEIHEWLDSPGMPTIGESIGNQWGEDMERWGTSFTNFKDRLENPEPTRLDQLLQEIALALGAPGQPQ